VGLLPEKSSYWARIKRVFRAVNKNKHLKSMERIFSGAARWAARRFRAFRQGDLRAGLGWRPANPSGIVLRRLALRSFFKWLFSSA